MILALADIHISVKVDREKSISIEYINKDKKFYFRFTRETKGPVLVGRSKNSHIPIDVNGLSRVHTTFEFLKSKNEWVVQDGIGEKNSTNGTW